MPTNYNPDTDALETMQERFEREAEVDERIMRGELGKAAKTEHTPEPWRVGRRGNDVIGSNGLGDTVAMMIDCDSDEQTHANARRIVAYVNACAGIPTDALEKGRMSSDAFVLEESRADKAEKQRDELLDEFNAYKEGSEEAFGTVVAQKQAAEARLQTMQSTIASQQGVICDFREQRDELLAALEYCRAVFDEYIGIHLDKTPPDYDKAARNENHRAACDASIANVKGIAA